MLTDRYQLERLDDRQQASEEYGIDLKDYEYVMRLRSLSEKSEGTEMLITRKLKREHKALPKSGTVFLTYPFKQNASASAPSKKISH